MDSEILRPDPVNPTGKQAFSPLGCFLAASGVTLLTFCLLGAAAGASVWAMFKLLGLPDWALETGFLVAAIPVVWATVWTAGRAWHVEQRLAQHLDVDTPVFQFSYYLRKRS